jgi:hypothetical protein
MLAGARALGYTGSSALPMQILNALAGALGVTLFYLVAQHATGRRDTALVAAMALGGSYAYWYYAVEVEVYTVAVLFLVLCLYMFVKLLHRPDAWGWMALGAAQALAVLFHQTNVLLCAPALAVWAYAGAKMPGSQASLASLRRRAVWLLLYLGTLGVLVALPYGIVAAISGFGSWAEFVAWTTSYARTGWWGGPITAGTWARLGQGLSETLAQPWGALFGLGLLVLLGLHLRALVGEHRALALCLLCWLLAYGGFFLWWEPDNIEFWIASLPPALLLLALALAGRPARRAGVWAGLALGAGMLALNGPAISWRGAATNDLQRHISTALARNSTPADLLLVPDGLQELYLPYYERRPNYLSLNQALADSAAAGAGSQQDGSWYAACDAVQRRIETTLASGGAVLIGAQVLRPPAELLQRHALAQQQIDACFERYRSSWHELGFAPPLPRYVRIPSAGELALAEGWSFSSGAQGWQAMNATTAGFAGGWRLVPRMDANLLSPLVRLESDQIIAIEVRLANGTQARDAQLFFADEQGHMDDRRSVRWTLEPTDRAVTYRIELSGQPGWQGVITRLRLDPVGMGDGGEVRVEWVRLVQKR